MHYLLWITIYNKKQKQLEVTFLLFYTNQSLKFKMQEHFNQIKPEKQQPSTKLKMRNLQIEIIKF